MRWFILAVLLWLLANICLVQAVYHYGIESSERGGIYRWDYYRSGEVMQVHDPPKGSGEKGWYEMFSGPVN